MESNITDVGPWSEIKIEIIRKYASAYAAILSKRKLRYHYIDGFSGAGVHTSRTSGNLVEGSPSVALGVRPPFSEYHFVDLNGQNISTLKALVESGTTGSVDLRSVYFYPADCNEALLNEVLPRVKYEEYKRALCLLDPYGLHLDWSVIHAAGQSKAVDLFLNFPIGDMNRNALLRDQAKRKDSQAERMTRFWGDASWKEAAYSGEGDLFGYEEKRTNDDVVRAFKERLKRVAGFKCVPEPLAMRNSTNAVVYYLFFASANETAARIARDIFSNYR